MKITDLRTVAVRVPVERPTAIATRQLAARDVARGLYRTYNEIVGTLVGMISHPETWILPK